MHNRILRIVGSIWIFLLALAAWPLSATLAQEGGTSAASGAAEPLRVGAASVVINNRLGAWVQGAGQALKASKIRDDLEANALYLHHGDTKLLLVSCDLVGLPPDAVADMREAMGEAADVPPRNIIIACTHTHGGPSLIRTNYLMPVDVEYLHRLKTWLVDLAAKAADSARPGKIGWAKGTAQIGFNRRVCWANGTHSMHGNTQRPDFAGLEGPDDPQHVALFAVDADDKLVAAVHHNTSHPTSYYAAGVYTAEYPGEARKILREKLGEIPVLYFNGAQGDIAMADQLKPKKESRDASLQRVGRMLADETLRLYEAIEYHDRPVLAHTHADLQVQVRLPTAERLADARKVLARVDDGENIRGMGLIRAFGAVHLQDEFGDNPVDTLPIHVIRIGDVALVTQPCELYCQFGLEIKRRSPAPITAVVGLADGYNGYCPTIYSILGGGYSGEPIYWTRLEPYAGYKIVESAGPMLNALWREPAKMSK